jgi:hypothetical protein
MNLIDEHVTIMKNVNIFFFLGVWMPQRQIIQPCIAEISSTDHFYSQIFIPCCRGQA